MTVTPVLGNLGGWGRPHCRAGGSSPAGVRRQERRQWLGGSRGRWAPAPCPQRPKYLRHWKMLASLSAQRDEVRVAVREPDAGHVAADHRHTRLGAWQERRWSCSGRGTPGCPPTPEAPEASPCVRARVLEEVLCRSRRQLGYDAHCGRAAQGVDVSSIRAIWPHTPVTAAGLSPTSPPPPAASRAAPFPPSPEARLHPPTTCPGNPSQSRGPVAEVGEGAALGWICQFDVHPLHMSTFRAPGWLHLVPPHSRRVSTAPALLTVDMEAQHAGWWPTRSRLIAILSSLQPPATSPGQGTPSSGFSPLSSRGEDDMGGQLKDWLEATV